MYYPVFSVRFKSYFILCWTWLLYNHCSVLSSLQPLWTCLFKTAKFIMMLAAISLPMGSCWQPSFQVVKEASLMKEYWLCILWHPTTWARCFTQSDLVSMQQEVRWVWIWEVNSELILQWEIVWTSDCSNRKYFIDLPTSLEYSTATEKLVVWSGHVRCWYGGGFYSLKDFIVLVAHL